MKSLVICSIFALNIVFVLSADNLRGQPISTKNLITEIKNNDFVQAQERTIYEAYEAPTAQANPEEGIKDMQDSLEIPEIEVDSNRKTEKLEKDLAEFQNQDSNSQVVSQPVDEQLQEKYDEANFLLDDSSDQAQVDTTPQNDILEPLLDAVTPTVSQDETATQALANDEQQIQDLPLFDAQDISQIQTKKFISSSPIVNDGI